MGRGVSRTVREDLKAKRRRAIILSLEQPVVGLEPDRSDPRMRLKQNWSLSSQGARLLDRLPIDWANKDARLGDESNQVS